jgi:hypothetical protein
MGALDGVVESQSLQGLEIYGRPGYETGSNYDGDERAKEELPIAGQASEKERERRYGADSLSRRRRANAPPGASPGVPVWNI